jgi:hypothetical protein
VSEGDYSVVEGEVFRRNREIREGAKHVEVIGSYCVSDKEKLKCKAEIV